MFKHVDRDCTIAALAKTAVDRALKMPLYPLNPQLMGAAADETLGEKSTGPSTPARQYLMSVAVNVLLQYRKLNTTASRAQLILPETLKLLPLSVLGMLKHPALVDNVATSTPSTSSSSPTTASTAASSMLSPLAIQKLTVRATERAFELRRLRSLPITQVLVSLYPRFFDMLDLIEDEIVDEDGSCDFGDFNDLMGPSDSILNPVLVPLPRDVTALSTSALKYQYNYQTLLKFQPLALPPSSEAFSSDSIYLLDDGSCMWLLVGRSITNDLLDALFILDSNDPSTKKRVDVTVSDDGDQRVPVNLADRPRLTNASLRLDNTDHSTIAAQIDDLDDEHDERVLTIGQRAATLVSLMRMMSAYKQGMYVLSVWASSRQISQ